MQKWVVINKKADFKSIGERFGIDQVTARIIRNRDIMEEEEIKTFLHGTRKDLHDPKLMKDAESGIGKQFELSAITILTE